MPETIRGLHPLEYEHPLDSQALDALKDTPGLDLLARQFVRHGVERYLSIQYTGSNIRVTERNHPDLHNILTSVCEILELSQIPSLYVEADEHVNALTVGIDHPIIVLSAGAVNRLSEKEMLFVIGHEVGHIKSRHGLYQLIAWMISSSVQMLGEITFGLGNLLSQPLQFALLRWSRCSEFSCDRAGLLACQDPNVAIDVMIKLAGLPESLEHQIHRDEFIAQAREFEALNFDFVLRVMKMLQGAGRSHPWTVVRGAELLKWVASGEYGSVLQRNTMRKITVQQNDLGAFCRNCGYRLENEDPFCPHCGASLQISFLNPTRN